MVVAGVDGVLGFFDEEGVDVVFADDDFVVVVSADGLAVFEEYYLGEGEAGNLKREKRRKMCSSVCNYITFQKNHFKKIFKNHFKKI